MNDTNIRTDNSVRITQVLRAAGGLITLGVLMACQTPRQHIISHENDLAAAGFRLRPADTAERQTLLAQLPAHRFVQRTKDGTVHYVYADPSVCKCLYVGTEGAYSQYQQNKQSQAAINQVESAMRQQNNAAADDDFNAQVYDNPAYPWEAWGPWDY